MRLLKEVMRLLEKVMRLLKKVMRLLKEVMRLLKKVMRLLEKVMRLLKSRDETSQKSALCFFCALCRAFCSELTLEDFSGACGCCADCRQHHGTRAHARGARTGRHSQKFSKVCTIVILGSKFRRKPSFKLSTYIGDIMTPALMLAVLVLVEILKSLLVSHFRQQMKSKAGFQNFYLNWQRHGAVLMLVLVDYLKSQR